MNHQGHISSQRLNRDVSELFSSNLDCSASYVTVVQTADSLNELGSISLEVRVFEGPYRGGRFTFCFHIPANYPFIAVEVWAVHPVWHPNIDLRTGRVALGLDWSPVLTLKSTALAVQMLMLEPSAENPLNLEAFSAHSGHPADFDAQVQSSIQGGWIAGVSFPCVVMSMSELALYGGHKISMKRSRDDAREHTGAKRPRTEDSMSIMDTDDTTNVQFYRCLQTTPRSLGSGLSMLSLGDGHAVDMDWTQAAATGQHPQGQLQVRSRA